MFSTTLYMRNHKERSLNKIVLTGAVMLSLVFAAYLTASVQRPVTPNHLAVTEQDSGFLVTDMSMGFMPKGFTQEVVAEEDKDELVITITTKSKGELIYREDGEFPITELITKSGKVNVYSLFNIKSGNREGHAYKVVNMSEHDVVLNFEDIDFSDPEIQESLGVVQSASMLPANNRLNGKSWWFDMFRIGKSTEGLLFTEVKK